jgi:Gpi16 subunit, GPI transamidase component
LLDFAAFAPVEKSCLSDEQNHHFRESFADATVSIVCAIRTARTPALDGHAAPLPLTRPSTMQALVHVLLALCLLTGSLGAYTENLVLTPLPHNSLLASFKFQVRSHRDSEKTLISSTHYAHLPRALGQILSTTHTHELHLRLTQGRWDEDWGSLPSNGQMAGGTGMEIWAWIDEEESGMYRFSPKTACFSSSFSFSIFFPLPIFARLLLSLGGHIHTGSPSQTP